MQVPKIAWLSAALGGGSALGGVVLALVVQTGGRQSTGVVIFLGLMLVLGATGVSLVASWQLAPEQRVLRTKAAAEPIQPPPPAPEAAPTLDLGQLPGVLLRLDGGEIKELSPRAAELSAEIGSLGSLLAPATLQALEAGERPSRWIWVAGHRVRSLHAAYLEHSQGLLVSLEDHSELERAQAEARLSAQRVTLARDLAGRYERPERAIAQAFQSLNEARAALSSGSPAATERALTELRAHLRQRGLPSVAGALSSPDIEGLRGVEAALRELETMAQDWLPRSQDPASLVRAGLARRMHGRTPPRVLIQGQGVVVDQGLLVLLAATLPVMLGEPEERVAVGLDPEGLLYISGGPQSLTVRVDGAGLDLDRQRALRGAPGMSDAKLLQDMLSGQDPESPFRELPQQAVAAKREGWVLELLPGQPSGPGRRRVQLGLTRCAEASQGQGRRRHLKAVGQG